MRSRVGTRSADVRVTCDTGFREEGRKKRKERKEGAISDESRRMGKFMLLRDTSGVTEECKRKAGGEAGVKGNRKTGLWSDLSFLLQTELAFFPRNTALFSFVGYIFTAASPERKERERGSCWCACCHAVLRRLCSPSLASLAATGVQMRCERREAARDADRWLQRQKWRRNACKLALSLLLLPFCVS